VLADTADALPEGQVLGVDGDSVVVSFTAIADVLPATLLLLEIKAGGVGKEEPGEEGTAKTKPGNDHEACGDIDVVVKHSSEKSTHLSSGGRETVSGGADWRREDLGGGNESDTVGTKLVEERREEVHSHERVEARSLRVVFVVESRDDEEDEVAEETDDLHPLAAVELVVDHERGKVVAAESDTNVDQVP